jgi:hypothetical protein
MSSYAEFFDAAGEHILAVLDDGVIDPRSRDVLGLVYRNLERAAALGTEQPSALDPEDDDEWAFWYRWCDHVGSIHFLAWRTDLRRGCIAHHAHEALQRARLVWCDELDAMSDRALGAVPGIGQKAVASIRAALDAYYWRQDEEASRQLWQHIDRRLREALDHCTRINGRLREARIIAGLELAERILAERGAPIADPGIVRMVA